MSRVDSFGLTLGLVNYPGFNDIQKFCNETFAESLLGPHKQRIADNGDGTELASSLLSPKIYRMLGENNGLFVTLVDDFTFVSRSMHPGHVIAGGRMTESFGVHVVNSVNIMDDPGDCSLEAFAQDTFLRPADSAYEYVGMVCFKINNSLLIGTGLQLLAAIKRRIRELFDCISKPEDGESPRLIIVHTLSNFELTALVFSRRVREIVDFVENARKLRVGSLRESEEEPGFLEESLLARMLSHEDKGDLRDAHLFSSTVTRVGYDPMVHRGGEKLHFQIDFELRTGHCVELKQKLKEEISRKEIGRCCFSVVPGAHTLRVLLEGVALDTIEELEKWIKETGLQERHVRNMRIKLVIPDEWLAGDDWEWSEMHPKVYDQLRSLRVHTDELEKLNTDLDTLGVSKVLRERMLKMMSLFNSCISDVTYFPSFMEMRGYLRDICTRIGKEASLPLSRRVNSNLLHDWIYNRMAYYERAYFNRSHHSAKFLNSTDSNLEYNGGMQQLITACDYAFKAVMGRVLGKETSSGAPGCEGMLFVSGYENVQSDASSLRVDITHLTSPELYAAILWKESLNFYYKRMSGVRTPAGTPDEAEGENERLQLKDLLKNKKGSHHFKYLVSYHKKLDTQFRAHDILYATVKEKLEEFLQYLVIDYYVFQNGYAGDIQLFSESYWNYFLQMPHKYDSVIGTSVNEKSFVIFMARWLFVVRVYERYSKGKGQKVDVMRPYDESVSELWVKHVADTLTFVDILVECMKNFGVLYSLEIESSRFLNDNLHPIDEKEKQREAISKIKDALQMCVTSIANGEVVKCDTNIDPGYKWVTYLGYGILSGVSRLRHTGCTDPFVLRVLKRGEKHTVDKEDNMAAIMADPLGGVFVYANGVRGDYFRMRMAYLFSLWDMAVKDKVNQVTGL